MRIPVGITARNEARNILQVISSMRDAITYAEARLSLRFELVIVLNDNADETPRLLDGQDVQILHTRGGIVEAQRALVENRADARFHIFSDADIAVGSNAVFAVAQAMLDDSKIEIAYAHKVPLPPRGDSWLARALYLYNLHEGYQSERRYFNGQFFAIRNWRIPRPHEIPFELKKNSKFLDLARGVRCDDIFLSRQTLREKGPEAIRLVNATIHYRPPETLKGMYRKYQRMRLEIERLHCLFPDSAEVHERWGRRRFVPQRLRARPLSEKLHFAWFIAHLYLCRAGYNLQKFYFTWLSSQPCPTWQPVLESKREIS